MSNWNKWRVVITATQAEDFVLRTESQGAPVVGPGGEPIDTAKSRIVEHRTDGEVKIKEMATETGTYYQFAHIKVTAPANQTTVFSKTFDADINIISAMCQCTADMKGDVICWSVDPNTTAGALTSPAAISDTVLSVPQTVIDNAEPLFRVRLALASDPTNTYEDVGVITDMDEVNSTITVTTPLTQAWAATTTLVQITAIYVDDVEAGPLDWVLQLGTDKIGASYLPKGRTLVCEYKNNHSTDEHELYAYFSYMYGRPKAD